jgi:hypothetical protein
VPRSAFVGNFSSESPNIYFFARTTQFIYEAFIPMEETSAELHATSNQDILFALIP